MAAQSRSESFSEFDTACMRQALEHADQVKGATFPNPAVGAVIARNNVVIAAGATQPCGGPHAEIVALQQAGGRARGATLYVTLEPCNHTGRTPPCTRAIAQAGISRVIAAVRDPNPLVSGKGLDYLRRRGITVRSGLLGPEATLINRDFFWSITTGRPWITLKLALTLDGRIADHTGRSQWITSPQARTWSHDLRRHHAAVVVGAGTVKADDPQLTVRHVPGVSPARIVLCDRPQSLVNSRLWQTAREQRTIIVSRRGRLPSQKITREGVELWCTACATPQEHLDALLAQAYSHGLTSIMVEGGQKTAAFFLGSGCVNRLCLLYGNHLLGGGLDGLRLPAPLTLQNDLYLDKPRMEQLGDSFLIDGLVCRRSPCSPD